MHSSHRLKRFYRSEAPPQPEPPDPPLPTWWERRRGHVIGVSVMILTLAAVVKFSIWMNAMEEHGKAKRRAARVEEFRAATHGCRLAERSHGERAEVVYQCDGRLERFPASWDAEAAAE